MTVTVRMPLVAVVQHVEGAQVGLSPDFFADLERMGDLPIDEQVAVIFLPGTSISSESSSQSVAPIPFGTDMWTPAFGVVARREPDVRP